jgi:hypothetical protein
VKKPYELSGNSRCKNGANFRTNFQAYVLEHVSQPLNTLHVASDRPSGRGSHTSTGVLSWLPHSAHDPWYTRTSG